MARGIMQDEVFRRILLEIDRFKDLIKVIVMYHGGEPLLNRNLHSHISQIRRIHPAVFIKTVSNGMALTPSRADELIKSGIDSIEFSLDGSSAEESEYVRRKSNTQKIIENILYLIDLKSSCRTNRPEILIATTQFVRDEGRPFPAQASVPSWLQRLFGGRVAGFKATYAIRWPCMGEIEKFGVRMGDVENKGECDHIINTMTVRADGTVVPCCYDLTSKLIMGDIRKNSLLNIWNNPQYQLLRCTIREKKYISICANCAVVRSPLYLVPKWNLTLTRAAGAPVA